MEQEKEVPVHVTCPSCNASCYCTVWNTGGDCVAFVCPKCTHLIEVYSNNGYVVYASDEGKKLHA